MEEKDKTVVADLMREAAGPVLDAPATSAPTLTIIPGEKPVDGGMKKRLSADDVLAADDIQLATVDVPEWGGFIVLKGMTGEQAVDFVNAIKDSNDKGGQAIKIVALCAVDENGAPLFTQEQVAKLRKKSLKALMRLQTKALEINGLSADAKEETKND